MRAEAYPLVGGMDIVSPQSQVSKGDVLLAYNYVPTRYGLRRSGHYERFDGQTAPSSLPSSDAVEQAAVEAQRALIAAVPGAGPVRGVAQLNDTIYAWRDNVGQTEARMYQATGSGWSEVATFTTAAYPAGGKYEHVVHNFGGHTGTKSLYVVTGVGKAFEWDGTTLTLITTGMTTDTPTHLAAHISYLFLAFPGGSLQWSPTGNPTGVWTPVIGAGEIGIGEEITVLNPTVGGSLFVGGATKTSILQGREPAQFDLREHSQDLGVSAYSLAEFGDLIFMSNMGITTLGATEAFGDFEHNSISNKIQPYIDSVTNIVGGGMDARNNHYWLLYNLNSTTEYICGSFDNNNRFRGFTVGGFGIDLYCFESLKVSGETRLFAGGADGFVYEINKGASADGEAVDSILKLPYIDSGIPLQRKRYFRAIAEVDSSGDLDLGFAYELNYGEIETPNSSAFDFTVSGGGGIWRVSRYGEFSWSKAYAGRLRAKLTGTGANISLSFSSRHTYEPPYTLQTVSFYYEPRRLER